MSRITTKPAAVIIFILMTRFVYSELSDFDWQNGECDCEGYFDSTVVSRAQLQNTYDYLLFGTAPISNVVAFTLDAIEKLDFDKVERQCDSLLGRIDTLSFVNNPFWKRVAKEQIEELRAVCELNKLTILGYKNPDTLRSCSRASDSCGFYVDALVAGGQTMVDAWRKLTDMQKKKNAVPGLVESRWYRKYISDQRLEYARLELITFGWWNVANNCIPRIKRDETFSEEFSKLFKHTDCRCVEP